MLAWKLLWWGDGRELELGLGFDGLFLEQVGVVPPTAPLLNLCLLEDSIFVYLLNHRLLLVEELPIEYEVRVLRTEEDGIEHLLNEAVVGSIGELEAPRVEEKVLKLDGQAQGDFLGGQFHLHLRDHLVLLLLRQIRDVLPQLRPILKYPREGAVHQIDYHVHERFDVVSSRLFVT
jgi:hypothetical protein